jgi:hypothetical protein
MNFLRRDLSFRSFFLSSLFWCLLVISLAVFVAVDGFVIDRKMPIVALLDYQVEKIKEVPACDIVFVGDSSLGNAIDAEYFTELSGFSSMNLALAGSYGYAGSYNMAKRAIEQLSPKLLIVVHTPGMMGRGDALKGFLLSAPKFSDLRELRLDQQMSLLNSVGEMAFEHGTFKVNFLSWTGSKPIKTEFEEDYIKQGPRIHPTGFERGCGPTVQDTGFFLQRLSELCLNNQVDLVYMHGPMYDVMLDRSKEYLTEASSRIIEMKIPLVPDLVRIPASELGDSYDHVHPDFKRLYTEKYYHSLNDSGALAIRQ